MKPNEASLRHPADQCGPKAALFRRVSSLARAQHDTACCSTVHYIVQHIRKWLAATRYAGDGPGTDSLQKATPHFPSFLGRWLPHVRLCVPACALATASSYNHGKWLGGLAGVARYPAWLRGTRAGDAMFSSLAVTTAIQRDGDRHARQ